jgi:hypothetical protein
MPTPLYGNQTNNGSNSTTDVSSGVSAISAISTYRVVDIILDDSDIQKWKKYGEWNGIGTIFIDSVKNPTFNESNSNSKVAAYPLFPNLKYYPLINELVPIIYLPNTNIVNNTNSVSPYYLPPINIWNSQIHNAIPVANTLPETQQRDYEQTTAGATVRRVEDESTEINLGKTFRESNVINIHPLLPYEGDVIYEGRFGNSIRLGSTVNNANIKNNWSNGTGKNGDPITIIRNGQGPLPTESWVPTTENVGNDMSSIYLTSTQQISRFTLASNIVDSYNKLPSTDIPTGVGSYSDKQIILNSGRLVFNANKDSIILSSEKSIHLSSDTTINMDGGTQIVLASPLVRLGITSGTDGMNIQPPVLGDNLNTLLQELSTFMDTLNIAFKNAADSFGAPIASLNAISCDAEDISISINNFIKDKKLLSKNVKIS